MAIFVDVSNNNGVVDFVALKKQGVTGVWLKVSEGLNFVDDTYRRNDLAARKAGLKVGGYHFGHPGGDAKEQAQKFLGLLQLHPGDLLPVLDLEVEDGKTSIRVHQWASAFVAEVKAKKKAWPVIYSGDYFMHAKALDTLPGPKWIASYGVRPHLCTHWAAWQYTGTGLDKSLIPNVAAVTYKAPIIKKIIGKIDPRKWRRYGRI